MRSLPTRDKLEHLMRSYVPRGFWADLRELIDQVEREGPADHESGFDFIPEQQPAARNAAS